jgi:hypothetical protein
MSEHLASWRTRSNMYGLFVYDEDVPTALRELARQLEVNNEQDLVIELSFGLSDEEGFVVGAILEDAP